MGKTTAWFIFVKNLSWFVLELATSVILLKLMAGKSVKQFQYFFSGGKSNEYTLISCRPAINLTSHSSGRRAWYIWFQGSRDWKTRRILLGQIFTGIPKNNYVKNYQRWTWNILSKALVKIFVFDLYSYAFRNVITTLGSGGYYSYIIICRIARILI